MEDHEPERTEKADMQAEEAELMERLQEEIRSLPVSEHLLYMMHSLSALAVGRMGLAPDAQGPVDLAQARLAIDGFKALLELLERSEPGRFAGQRSALSQLQLAYVGVLNAGKTEAGGPEVGGPEAGGTEAGASETGEPGTVSGEAPDENGGEGA